MSTQTTKIDRVLSESGGDYRTSKKLLTFTTVRRTEYDLNFSSELPRLSFLERTGLEG